MVREEGNITRDGLYIGVDGCRGGWVAAVLARGELRLKKYESIESLVQEYPSFDAFLIDMAVGLQDRAEQVGYSGAAEPLFRRSEYCESGTAYRQIYS